MAMSTKKEQNQTKPNETKPTLYRFRSRAPNWTNSFNNCVGDTNTHVAFLPIPCYKIIYFMLHFHRSLVMFSYAPGREVWEVYGAAKTILSTCFLWALIQI